MNKRILFFFIFLLLSHPLHADTLPEKSIAQIVKVMANDDYATAGELVNQFLKERPEDIWHFRALYLKAHISSKLSKLNNAVDIYLKLLSKYPQLKDYTMLKLAGIRLELGEENESIELLNSILKEFPRSRLHPYAKFFLGKLHFSRDDLEKAYKFFTDIIEKYPKKDLVPESMLFTGVILKKQGKIINAYETFSKLFHSFPLNEFSIEAEEKIREMRKAKIKLPEFPPKFIARRIKLLMKEGEYSIASRECKKYLKTYTKGNLFQDLTFKLAKAYTLMRKRKEALQIYKSFITKNPTGSRVPEAQYKIANLYWNLGKHRDAIAYSKKIINNFPHSHYAEKAFYTTGKIFAQNKKYRKAISQFQKMTKTFPQGSLAVSAHWNIGLINYISGNYRTAAKKFKTTASLFHDSRLRGQILYWAGKSNEKSGETEAARSFYKMAAKEYPYNYYGYRGKVKLSKKSGNKLKMINPFLQRKLNSAQVYKELKTKMRSEDRFHFIRIKELIALGYYEDALGEIRLIARKVSINTPEKILWTGNLYLQARGFVKAQRIIEGFLKELPTEKHLELSLEYWKLYFPIAYSELVNKNAKGYKLDPFLIVGLMRQESSFNPDSLSRSGAIGLMQLMPKTGKNEFKKRYKSAFSEKDWHEEILYIPRVNISLGSQHMAYLLKKTKGDPVIALAGYNAGLSRALKWKKTIITPDPDLFIEMIPFRETKAYVKKVMRNYFNYITLYGDGEEKDKVLALNTKDL